MGRFSIWLLAVRKWLCGWSGGNSGASVEAEAVGRNGAVEGAVEGAAFSAVPSDCERLCCPMMDLSTEVDLLRRWPAAAAAGVGAGAAMAKAATTSGENRRCFAGGGNQKRCSGNVCRLQQGHVWHVGGADGVDAPDGSCLVDVSKQSAVAPGTAATLAGAAPSKVARANARVTPQFDFLLVSGPLVPQLVPQVIQEPLRLATASC